MALSHAQYDVIERAVAAGRRLVVTRRGVPWVVVAQRLEVRGATEHLVTRHPSTGETVLFDVTEIDRVEEVR